MTTRTSFPECWPQYTPNSWLFSLVIFKKSRLQQNTNRYSENISTVKKRYPIFYNESYKYHALLNVIQATVCVNYTYYLVILVIDSLVSIMAEYHVIVMSSV